MSRVETQFEIEGVFSQHNSYDRCIGNTAIQLCGRIDGRRQTELLTLVLACKANATFFDETPKARHDEGSFVVERKHPVVVAVQHRLEAMLCEPS